MNDLDRYRLPNGCFRAYTSFGCYPLFYMSEVGDVICAKCASCSDEPVIGVDVHWEGDPISCELCDDEIESAYGEF